MDIDKVRVVRVSLSYNPKLVRAAVARRFVSDLLVISRYARANFLEDFVMTEIERK